MRHPVVKNISKGENIMNDVQTLISQHSIIDVDECIHVVDGICIYYEPNTIDFTDINQVKDLFDFIETFKHDAFLNERHGKNNTCIFLSGSVSEREKDVGFDYLTVLPEDKLEIVRRSNLWIFK